MGISAFQEKFPHQYTVRFPLSPVLSEFLSPEGMCMCMLSHLCPTPGSSVHRILWTNTGVGCHSLLQGIFLAQGSNPSLLYCRRSLCSLSHQGRPKKRWDGLKNRSWISKSQPGRVTCAGPVSKKLFFPLITLFTHLTWQVRRVRMLWMSCETEVYCGLIKT